MNHRAGDDRPAFRVPPEKRSPINYKGYWIALAVLLFLALCFGGLVVLSEKIGG